MRPDELSFVSQVAKEAFDPQDVHLHSPALAFGASVHAGASVATN